MLMALVGHRRKRLLLDELLAAGLTLGLALLVGKLSGTDWSDSLGSLVASKGPPVYLAVRLAMATAVVVVASPHMTHALRFFGRAVIVAGAFAGIALGVTLPIGVVTGFIVGIGSAAIVHLLVGSPAGRLTLDQVAAALDEIGVEATDLRQAPLEPRGVALATADRVGRAIPAGEGLRARCVGRSAARVDLVRALAPWRVTASRCQPSAAGRARGLPDPDGGTRRRAGDAGGGGRDGGRGRRALVSEATARSFDSLDPAEVDDGLLRTAWEMTERLHGLGLAHGQIDGMRLRVRTDGSLALTDFGKATIAATQPALMTDRAQVLLTTALTVGQDRAIAAARASLGDATLAEVLPFLQPAVFDRLTMRDVKDADWSLKDLREAAASATGIEPPKLERIRRVTVRSVLTVVLIAVFAYAIIAALAGVDLQQLVDELQSADKVWLWVALLLTPVVQVFQAFSTIGASIHPVRYGPVLMLQYAIQFIALAVPSSAARIALEIRFFQRMGIEVGGATSIGLVDSVSGFTIQILLIVIILATGLAGTLDTSGGSSSGSGGSSDSSSPVWVLLVALLLIGIIIGLAVPRYRATIKEAWPRYRTKIRDQRSEAAVALHVLRHPKKIALLFGGNLAAQVLLAVILGICLKAFGHSATLAQLILVNTFVSLFAGFMPVPGGMGVSEAGYTAGLEAIGIPSAVAMSTAIAFRLVTFYLPPIWGAYGMRWLRQRSFV